MGWRLAALLALLLGLFPLVKPPAYFLVLVTTIFMNLALAESWTILGGYAGYLSFGHATFFGIGAYTTGILLLKLGWNPFLTFPLAGLLAAAFTLLIAYPLLKVRGAYFAVITMLVALVVGLVLKNIPFLGGTTGLFLPAPRIPIDANRMLFYYAMMALAALATGVAAWVQHSKLGAGLAAIRQNEAVAEAVGVNTTQVKIVAFVLSAFMTGLVGGIYSYMRSYISTDMAFDLHVSTGMFVMALFGGSQQWTGPVVGAFVLSIVGEILTVTIGAEAARIAYGLFLIVIILLMPQGVVRFVQMRRGGAPARAR